MFKNVLYLALVSYAAAASGPGPSRADSTDSPDSCSRRLEIAGGIALMAGGYATASVIAVNVWWREGFRRGNPFDNVSELEPYIEDDAWHLAGSAMLTEFNYRVFDRLIGLPHPEALACGLTLAVFTGVECLDALERTGKWGFSVNDEIANCLGAGYWYLKQRRPGIPVLVRVGVRRWGRALRLTGDALAALRDYDAYRRTRTDHYNVLKVEMIYNFYRDFHAGLAVSKTERPENRNCWGIVAGYDFTKAINRRAHGWWNGPLALVGKYCAIHAGYTFWFD
jgi:hypothetical protein